MFKHLYKLIWNKRKQNFLLMLEVLVSFMVLFAIFSMLVYYYQNYRKPMGFNYDNVWAVNYSDAYQSANADSMMMFYEGVKRSVKAMPGVIDMTYASSNIPFSGTTNNTSINHNKGRIRRIDYFQVDDSYADALNIKLVEGRWYNKTDAVSPQGQVVINETLKQQAFGSVSAVGKTLGDNDPDRAVKVIGVVQDVKIYGDYVTAGPGMYTRIDTGTYKHLRNMLIRVAPDADAALESKLYKVLANAMKNANVEILHLTDMRKSRNSFFLIPLIVVLVVAGFLIINVALGLFGVLWYNINRRRGEIGLRRAVGASGNSISIQLVGEALVLATFALVAGSFFAVQFPLLQVFEMPASVYLIAIVCSIVFIYLLVIVCALYPGKQAAAIYPAIALHED